MKLVDSEITWLASAIDFEGSILMYPSTSPGANNVRCNVTILTNTNYQLIKHATKLLEKAKLKFRIVPLSKTSRWKSEWKEAWRVEISPVDSNKVLLNMVRPYLIAKSEQCDLAIEFLSRRSSSTKVKTTEYEWSLMRRCQELNKRGHSESVETIRKAGETPEDIGRTSWQHEEVDGNIQPVSTKIQ
jgi:hypothetical protein